MAALVILVAIVALVAGLKLGRAWGFRKLGSFEYRERIRRSKGGGIF